MSLIDVIDKQSNKLVSKSGTLRFDPETEQFINSDITGYPIKNSPVTSTDIVPSIQSLFAGLQTTPPSISKNTNTNNIQQQWLNQQQQAINNQRDYNNRLLAQNKDMINHKKNMDITNTVFSSLGGLTNLGLGIWQAIEQNKLIGDQRDLLKKQLQIAEEDRLYRDKERKRLDKVRGNTSKQFSSGAVISRSY